MKDRLIVSDVDGTLLKKGEKEVNVSILNQIENLAESNYFAVASGRSYAELERLFYKVKDKIYFICLDGAITVYKDKLIFSLPLEKEVLKKMYSLYAYKDNINLLFYSDDINYAFTDCEMFWDYIQKAFSGKVMKIRSLDEIKHNVYKVSAVTTGSNLIEKNDIYIKNNRLLRKIYEDKYWNDYVRKDADKQRAIDNLKQVLNISYENTIVFGDNFNDTGLLRAGKSSFVLDTAPNTVKPIAKYVIKDILPELIKLGEDKK